ncbi:MAG: HD-GYP domain-containing protein [Candidatus Omnitrophota bacterium]
MVNYRKKLEQAARQMIAIHNADTLVKIILRTVIRTIRVKHAGILIYDSDKDAYIVRISRGHPGFRIPSGFVKVSVENPVIRYFTDRNLKFPKDILTYKAIESYARTSSVKKNKRLKRFIENLKTNLFLYQAKVCIPGFFRKDLIGVLFLGEKINKKPIREEEIGFLSVLASDVVMALKNAWLIEDLNKQLEINKRLFLQIVSALASSIEAKDRYTSGHTSRVVEYSLAIVRNLKRKKIASDWEKFHEDVRISALLHDIGKIGIPENILNKTTPLDEKELKIVQVHPLIGLQIIDHVKGFGEVQHGIQYHHERYDGGGYPYGLKGRKIPLIASIIALADAYDAMTTDRPYRKALTKAKALEEIKKNRKKQFSPPVVDAFLKAIKEIDEENTDILHI